MKVLVTCPPMLRMIEVFEPLFQQRGFELTAPEVLQTMSEGELTTIVPEHDGWIIGDDPASRAVLTAGRAGNLKAAVKWGVGINNVDVDACRDLDIPFTNTPHMFGSEVADIALGYIIGLARHTFEIDRGVRQGLWPKPAGISLAGRTAALIGFGDIGKNIAERLLAANMHVIAYDPVADSCDDLPTVERAEWPARLQSADFIVAACALTDSSHHMINEETLELAKPGVRIVNVGRGPVIDEVALEAALKQDRVFSAALDVFETEPLPGNSYLRTHPRCILGSHNSSNTADATIRTSELTIEKMTEFLAHSASL